MFDNQRVEIINVTNMTNKCKWKQKISSTYFHLLTPGIIHDQSSQLETVVTLATSKTLPGKLIETGFQVQMFSGIAFRT
jgi:hypothetical protein